MSDVREENVTLTDPDADIQNCVICLDQLTKEDDSWYTPCIHGFHRPCLQEWLDNKRNNGKIPCPICKCNITVLLGIGNGEMLFYDGVDSDIPDLLDSSALNLSSSSEEISAESKSSLEGYVSEEFVPEFAGIFGGEAVEKSRFDSGSRDLGFNLDCDSDSGDFNAGAVEANIMCDHLKSVGVDLARIPEVNSRTSHFVTDSVLRIIRGAFGLSTRWKGVSVEALQRTLDADFRVELARGYDRSGVSGVTSSEPDHKQESIVRSGESLTSDAKSMPAESASFYDGMESMFEAFLKDLALKDRLDSIR